MINHDNPMTTRVPADAHDSVSQSLAKDVKHEVLSPQEDGHFKKFPCSQAFFHHFQLSNVIVQWYLAVLDS